MKRLKKFGKAGNLITLQHPCGDSIPTMPAAREPRDGVLKHLLFQWVFQDGQLHTAGHWTAQI